MDEFVEEGGFGLVASFGSVVALASEEGDELGSGLEEPALLADGFVDAVDAEGPVAVAVAEEASVGFDGEAFHVGAFEVSGQRSCLVVGGFDGLGDSEVFVGDGAVGDAGVGEGHVHGAVAEQGGDGF